MKRVLFLAAMLLLTGFVTALESAAEPGERVKTCLKNKECTFEVTETSTADPTMSFLVLRRVWNKFTSKDKNDLREILRERVREARTKPEKYVASSSKSPVYDALVRNLKNMKSYSVLLSYSRSDGTLVPLEEALRNY